MNYRANIWALKSLGVERIYATNFVGAINERFRPGDFVIPHDIIDFTKSRAHTFYDEAPATHIDVTQPYCPELRSILAREASKAGRAWDGGVYACTEGPRFETPAEIRMLKVLGADVVGMTGAPEAFLAKELEMCYAAICIVSNMAVGLQSEVRAEDVLKLSARAKPSVEGILRSAVSTTPEARSCQCRYSLQGARI